MASEDQQYRRGSIFGFTVAEVILLLLFCLLMALAHRLIKIQKKYEVDKKTFEAINQEFLAKISNSDEILIIKEKFVKFVEDVRD